MHADPETIERQKKGSFASYLRGVTPSAIPLQFPFGVMERMPRMLPSDRDALQQRMRLRYSIHYSELQGAQSAHGAGVDREITDDVQEPTETPTGPPEPTKGW